jgi:hypothetical protein
MENGQLNLKAATWSYKNNLPVVCKCNLDAVSISRNQFRPTHHLLSNYLLFLKKLNHELYKIHLRTAQEWGNTWNIIHDSILNSINKEMEKKYKSIEDKLNRLTLKQTKNPNTNTHFYPRVVNETAIKFSNDEMTLLACIKGN